jgi:hypothetical protein
MGGDILVNGTLENESVSSFWELQAYVHTCILNFIWMIYYNDFNSIHRVIIEVKSIINS